MCASGNSSGSVGNFPTAGQAVPEPETPFPVREGVSVGRCPSVFPMEHAIGNRESGNGKKGNGKARNHISPTSTPVLCVAATVCGLPAGATNRVIAKRVALSLARTKNLLSVANRAGLVGKVQHGRAVLWMSPAAAQAARLARRAVPAKPRWALGENLPDGPVQLRVPVDAPLPFRCTAVNSVFALGAAA